MPEPHVAVIEPVDEPGRARILVMAEHELTSNGVDELIRRLIAAKHKAHMATPRERPPAEGSTVGEVDAS